MNLAPVLDVNSNPVNPVIGIRSFGEDPSGVATHGAAYVAGLQSSGVAAVAKHFPGHGDTQEDSHYALPTLPHTRERLLEVELAPFAAAIEAGLDAVMTAHIALPEIEGRPNVPATVSQPVLTGLLREALGFEGVIVTDGLEMQAIIDTYGSGPAAVKAMLAGADMMLILWFPEKRREVYQALLAAVGDGTITEARLDASVRRILTLKVRRGLFDSPSPPLEEALAELGDGTMGREVADEIASRAVTLVRGAQGLTPISRERYRNIVVLSANRAFAQEMAARFPGARIVHTPAVPSVQRRQADVATTRRLAQNADLLVVGAMNGYQSEMVKALSNVSVPRIVVSMGSPYMLGEFPDVEAYLAAYSYQPPAGRAAARFLAGDLEAKGRLPVSLPGLYPLGHTAASEGAPAGQDADPAYAVP
jgi:beta-N-acetylhexosaminidase